MESSEELRNLIAKHTVRYEIWRHVDIYDDKRVTDGFDLELHGTHDHGHTQLSPGCELCRGTYGDLRKIAETILPKEERLSIYEIPSFDSSLHTRAGGRLEVVLTICIRHRSEYFADVDQCEERCLQEMTGKLKALGVADSRRSGHN
jgi:hypothetical protein